MRHIQFLSIAMVTLAAIFGSTVSSAACQPEIQFFGKIHNVQAVYSANEVAFCTYQIALLPSSATDPECRLDERKANAFVFTDMTCSLQNNGDISGNMIEVGDTMILK